MFADLVKLLLILFGKLYALVVGKFENHILEVSEIVFLVGLLFFVRVDFALQSVYVFLEIFEILLERAALYSQIREFLSQLVLQLTFEVEFLFSLAGYAVYVFFESVDVLALFAQNIERVFYCVKLIFILALTLLSLLHRVKVFLYARKHFVEFSAFGGNLYLTVADILVVPLELFLIIGKVFFCRREKLFYLLLFYSVIFKTLFVLCDKSFVRKHSRARSLLRTAANRTCSTQHVAFQCNYTHGISVLSGYRSSVVDIVYYKSTPEQ